MPHTFSSRSRHNNATLLCHYLHRLTELFTSMHMASHTTSLLNPVPVISTFLVTAAQGQATKPNHIVQ